MTKYFRNDVASAVIVMAVLLATTHVCIAASSGNKIRLWPDNLFGVDFVSAELGFVTGYAGTVLRTRDAGAHWEWSNVGVDELLRRVTFVDADHGWAVGHRGSIVHTVNGGDSWSVQHQQTGVYLRDIAFVDREHGWAIGHEATILATRDGGTTWTQQRLTGFTGRDLPRLHGVAAIDARRAILVGEFGVVAITDDGGELWQVEKVNTDSTLLDVAYVGRDRFVAVGLDGIAIQLQRTAPADAVDEESAALLKTTAIKTGTTEHYFAVTDAGRGRVLATGRSVVTLIDGTAATPVMPQSDIQLPFTWFGGVAVSADERFWLVGIRGVIASGSLADGSFSRAADLGSSPNIRHGVAAGAHRP